MTAPLFAPLADKYGRRPVFLTCVFMWGVGAVSYGLVSTVLGAVVGRGFCTYIPDTPSRGGGKAETDADWLHSGITRWCWGIVKDYGRRAV